MAMHRGRYWQITDVETAEELAGMLTGQDWTLCSGFRFGGFLWLNDSTSEDGAQEYAVVREDELAQVESVTFGWCSDARGLSIIREIVSGEGVEGYGHIDPSRIETPEQHGRCGFCA